MTTATTSVLLRTSLAAVSLCGIAAAQLGVITLPTGTGDDPRCVHFIGNNHVVVSDRVDGWQHFVDVAVPNAPSLTSSLNPPFGDQWFEAEYTSDIGGRLFTGHRGGGINMIDVSNPSLPVVLASIPTTYHFRGLRYQPDPVGGVLHYNATNEGLGVYQIIAGGNGLTAAPIWNNYTNTGSNDGNGLELMGNQLYQFGKPNNAPTTRLFKGFDVSWPWSPVQNYSTTLTNQLDSHTQLRKSLLPAPRLFASQGANGLTIYDTTVPNAPIAYPILTPISGLTLNCWGCVSFPNSPFALAYGSIWATSNPSVKYHWWLLLTVPPVGAPSVGPILTTPFETRDINVDGNTGRVYVVGRDAGGQGKLWIY